MDPEKLHDRMILAGKILGGNPVTRGLTGLMFGYQNPMLEQNLAGIKFKNPVGLAAGFDKEAFCGLFPAWVLALRKPAHYRSAVCGNPGPWLWRLPEHQAIRVNYGLKNSGAPNIHKCLSGKKFDFILGISLAKTNSEATSHVKAGHCGLF